ncbi:hypothetical protein BDN72DRAFT_845260 [Pluteus cervinus]|uniref:Uncharacterized protein n=1 Tax=Pluteus cervinus TaxID=181527 RepID=A0ACD3AIT2_9AGAR|nr:hypothetical protein BDN72DRAFT_845260 [Pluteus cervinus]
MDSVWIGGPSLIAGSVFEAAYPDTHRNDVIRIQETQMTEVDRNKVANNIFQHPILDLEPIFDHVRNTDLAVPSDHIADVQNVKEHCNQDIKTLETKISTLLASLGTLSRELSETSCQLVQRSRQLRVSEYILSRPKHLPQDILERIFITCWELQEPNTTFSVTTVPFQLASVCHRWRAVALSTPTLWSNIRVKNQAHLACAKAWITRCHSPMLTLSLGTQHDITSSDFEDLFDAIQNSSLKFQKLDLCSDNGDRARMVSAALFGRPCDNLEELVIRDSHQPDDIPSSVRRLYLHNPPASWATAPPPPNLTVLCVTMKDHSIHWSMVESILFHCPNLEQVTLRTAPSGMKAPEEGRLGSPFSPLALEHLIYLGISNDCSTEQDLPKDFLGNFSFPKLRVLEYKVGNEGKSRQAWLIAHSLLTQIRRFSLQLEVDVSIDDFRSLFSPASSLEEFLVYCTTDSLSNFLQLLTSPPITGPNFLLPSLKSLHLGGWEATDTTQHSTQLVEFVRAWSPESRGQENSLKSLNFQIWYNANDDNTPSSILDDAIREASATLKIKLIRYPRTFLLVNIPLLFEIPQKPFNAVRTYEVMDMTKEAVEVMVWRTEPIYSVSAHAE